MKSYDEMKRPVPTKSLKTVRQGNMHTVKRLIRQNLMLEIINICTGNLKGNSSANLNSLTKQLYYSEHYKAEGPELNHAFQFFSIHH